MGIKSVIFDLDDTLIMGDGSPVDGVPELLDQLKTWNLKIVVTSNKERERAATRLRDAGLPYHMIVSRDETGVKKGSQEWVSYPCRRLGLKNNETIYVGHSNLDMRTAANARVLFMNVPWAPQENDYGYCPKTPSDICWFVSHFLMKNHLWFWSLDDSDDLGRSVKIRSVVDATGAGDRDLKRTLIQVLKKKGDSKVNGFSAKKFILFHLLGSIYLDGVYRDVDFWTTYPGHEKGSTNEVMGSFLEIAARTFKERYLEDLIIRHTSKREKSSYMRTKGIDVSFTIDETNTTKLNLDYIEKIRGKKLLVIDDFSTDGYSFECARNMFLSARVENVTCISIGKYNIYHRIQNLRPGLVWNPFQASDFNYRSDFVERWRYGSTNQDAMQEFKNSYDQAGQIRSP